MTTFQKEPHPQSGLALCVESNYSCLFPSSLHHVGPAYQIVLHPRLLTRGAEGGGGAKWGSKHRAMPWPTKSKAGFSLSASRAEVRKEGMRVWTAALCLSLRP